MHALFFVFTTNKHAGNYIGVPGKFIRPCNSSLNQNKPTMCDELDLATFDKWIQIWVN